MRMTIAESFADRQSMMVMKVHNWRYKTKAMEYRLRYDGGITEHITIQGRRNEKYPFRYVNSFDAYTMKTPTEIIDHASAMLGV